MAGTGESGGDGPAGPDGLPELLRAVPADLTDGEVTDGLLALIELSGRVQAATARFTASFDARCLCSVDGARSVAAGWRHEPSSPGPQRWAR